MREIIVPGRTVRIDENGNVETAANDVPKRPPVVMPPDVAPPAVVARQNQVDAELRALSNIIARRRAEIEALPDPASRTPAQRALAQTSRDLMILARGILIISGHESSDDLNDGGAA
jgi:hypothetical protein